jgi:tetratricopeptide (TPR) repeat protein
LQKKIDGSNTQTDQLALAYGQMGMLFMAAEFREEAEAALLDAQTFNPRDARWPYCLAHLYKVRGDVTQSAAAFSRALELQPDDVPTLVWLGEARLDAGKPDEAEPLFTKALAIQPRLVVALFGLGRASLARQDYARAVESLERALQRAAQWRLFQAQPGHLHPLGRADGPGDRAEGDDGAVGRGEGG